MQRRLPPKISSLPNQEAFYFLEDILEARFQFASAQAILRVTKSITDIYVEHALAGDYSPFQGRSRGRDFVLEESKKFFHRLGIKSCEVENISLNEGVLSAIGKAYEILDIRVGNKILVVTPTFGYYFQQLQSKGIAFETVNTKKEDDFLINPIALEESIIKSGARVILLCYPNNPTGSIMTKENAEEVAGILKKYNVFTIQDGIFFENNLLNEGSKNYPIAAVDGMLERSLTLYGFSKSMGVLPGATAVGVGSKEFIAKFVKLGGYPILDEKVIAAALKDSEENRDYLEKSRLEYLSRIKLIKEKVEQLNERFGDIFGERRFGEDAFVKPYISDPKFGSVYLLDFSGLFEKYYNDEEMTTGLDVAKWLLKEASVGVVPGECFMLDPQEMLVRISLHNPCEEINMAFDSIIKAADKIHNLPSKSLVATAIESLKGVRSRL